MPNLAAITDEQHETFIRKGINTSYGQKILAEIVGSTGAKTTQQTNETAAQSNTATAAKPPQPPQNNGNPNTDESKTAQQTQATEPDKSGGGATVIGQKPSPLQSNGALMYYNLL